MSWWWGYLRCRDFFFLTRTRLYTTTVNPPASNVDISSSPSGLRRQEKSLSFLQIEPHFCSLYRTHSNRQSTESTHFREGLYCCKDETNLETPSISCKARVPSNSSRSDAGSTLALALLWPLTLDDRTMESDMRRWVTLAQFGRPKQYPSRHFRVGISFDPLGLLFVAVVVVFFSSGCSHFSPCDYQASLATLISISTVGALRFYIIISSLPFPSLSPT
jgi:hypothetical protein